MRTAAFTKITQMNGFSLNNLLLGYTVKNMFFYGCKFSEIWKLNKILFVPCTRKICKSTKLICLKLYVDHYTGVFLMTFKDADDS